MGHIELSRAADLLVVAPATADLMAKMAQGLANDLASTALLATDKPVLIAPAMNVRMWHACGDAAQSRTPARRDGIAVVGPNDGEMACGEYGPGRMAEPAEIVAAIEASLRPAARPLAGQEGADHRRADARSRSIPCATSPTIPPASRAMPSPQPPWRSAPRRSWSRGRSTCRSRPVSQMIAGRDRRADARRLRRRASLRHRHLRRRRRRLARRRRWRIEKIKKSEGRHSRPRAWSRIRTFWRPSPGAAKAPGARRGFCRRDRRMSSANARAKLAAKGCDLIVANDVSAGNRRLGRRPQ